jgi:hypothetical protein
MVAPVLADCRSGLDSADTVSVVALAAEYASGRAAYFPWMGSNRTTSVFSGMERSRCTRSPRGGYNGPGGSMSSDLGHGPPIGPHWDWVDPVTGAPWRVYPPLPPGIVPK